MPDLHSTLPGRTCDSLPANSVCECERRNGNRTSATSRQLPRRRVVTIKVMVLVLVIGNDTDVDEPGDDDGDVCEDCDVDVDASC